MTGVQTCALPISIEAEYIAVSEAAKEAVWIRNLLMDLGVLQGASNSLDVYCDNNGAIAQAKEDDTRRTNIYSCVTTSFVSSLNKVISSYAR